MTHWWTYMWCRQLPPRLRRTCYVRGVRRDHGRRRPHHQQHSPGPPKDNHQGRHRQHPVHSRNPPRHQDNDSSSGSARRTCWIFHCLRRPQAPQKHIHVSHPSVPRGYPVVSPRTATPATALTNRASCPRRVVPQHPRCSHVTVGW